jgi:hypothetical protein
MAKEKPATIGHINCPTCGMLNGMAIKKDKNGDAFGFCEDCSQQLFTRNLFKSKLLLQRMRPVTAPASPEPVTAPVPAPDAPTAPTGAGAASAAPDSQPSTEPEKTPPAPAPAAAPARKPVAGPWFAPIIGKSARKAA